MEEFKPSSKLEIGNLEDLAMLRFLELEMEEFELSSKLGIGN